ncbi:hypothetical protein BDY17DRAFT_36451 [Neohortaea acidophila]|uniref:Uncharacterized protein n=1 Tax=Neohortaea acidophila TaxID=245834 RepID=A0A6A6PL05_9PEZI|nr:uncharacterized protein BDY17DRAFT_36451 [Neohortaea acidophila]KAF2480344.1 hypothetical protein BDY17DRAFT_36451 [Neohortaea acidophila]
MLLSAAWLLIRERRLESAIGPPINLLAVLCSVSLRRNGQSHSHFGYQTTGMSSSAPRLRVMKTKMWSDHPSPSPLWVRLLHIFHRFEEHLSFTILRLLHRLRHFEALLALPALGVTYLHLTCRLAFARSGEGILHLLQLVNEFRCCWQNILVPLLLLSS